MRVLITGGTGTLGTRVVRQLLADGRATPRILSRSEGEPAPGVERYVGDIETGEGLRKAIDGVDIVMHLAHAGAESTAHLLDLAREGGVGRVAFIGVLGADRMPHPYFAMKVAAERAVADSDLPSVTLRATQFHAFMDWHLDALAAIPFAQLFLLDGDAVFQTVDEREVADRLVRLTLDGRDGDTVELAGPHAMTLSEMASAWAAGRGREIPFLAGRAADDGGSVLPSADWARDVRLALTSGAATASEHAEIAEVTWTDYLAASSSARE